MTKKKRLTEKSSGEVFANPACHRAQAHHLRLRGALTIRVEREVHANGPAQTEAVSWLPKRRPQIRALLRGQIGEFSLDALMPAAALFKCRLAARDHRRGVQNWWVVQDSNLRPTD